jgi:hypothetical protein
MMQPITSGRVGLAVAPEAVQLAPGSQMTIVLTVTNQGTIVDQFGLVVEGLDPTWFTVREGMVNLFPGAVGLLEIDIHLPEGTDAVAGTHQVTLRVLSREAPDEPATVVLPIDVLAIGGITAAMTPQRRTIGRRGSALYTIALTNNGNADAVVDLAIRDPEEALDVGVNPDRVSVPHAGSAEATISARPRKRPLVSLERPYTFIVEAVRPVPAAEADSVASETLAMVVGELVYHPPFATLAALPLNLRRLLMALAALALAAALLIWFLAAPGRRGALIERLPVTKPIVAAVETALNLPEKVAAADAGADAAADGGAGGPAPQIKRFVLATPGTDGRTDYALVWEVEGADEVKIAGAEQPDPKSGSLRLDKLQNTEYVLEATRGGVTVNQSVGIVILRPPDIQDLAVTPDAIGPGQTAKLRWKAARGDRASLGEQTVDPDVGSLDVSPAATTTYTLVVENELGRTERSVQLRVTGGPAPPKP